MQPGNPPGQDPYQQPQHGQPQPPQYGQDPYQQPQYGQPQPPQYGQPQYGQPQYGQPQYEQPPQYGQPQYGQPPGYPDPYAPQQPQYADPYGAPQPVSADPYAPTSPGYPPAPYTGYGAPSPAQNNTLGLLGMIFGILAVPLICCWPLGIVSGIAGVVLGLLGMKKANEGQASNRGMALAGAITGGAAILLIIILFVAGVGIDMANLV